MQNFENSETGNSPSAVDRLIRHLTVKAVMNIRTERMPCWIVVRDSQDGSRNYEIRYIS